MTGIDRLQDWVGRTAEAEDVVTPRLVAGFSATLAGFLADQPQGCAPLGIHWCLAPETVDAAGLGPDGHPHRGGFLPPVELPRRMWASGELEPLAPIRVGDTIHRQSTVRDIAEKNGRSGRLTFVTVEHILRNAAGPVLRERQVIVYREAAKGPVAEAGPPDTLPAAGEEWQIGIDPVILFRYSALTFNGHRIHYDWPYATATEHYPGLVIHGPLQATLMLNLAASLGRGTPKTFAFRGVKAATGIQRLNIRAANAGTDLSVVDAGGHLTMTGDAAW